MKRICLLGAVLFAAIPLAAQGIRKPVTVEMLTAKHQLGAPRLLEVKWRPGRSDEVSFLLPPAADSGTLDLWVENVRDGKRSEILAASEIPSAGENKAADPKALEGYRWSPRGDSVLFSSGDNLWIYEVTHRKFRRLTDSKGDKEFPRFSPDGSRVAYVEANNIYCVETDSGRVTQLTRDGKDNLIFDGRLDWLYEEELASRSGRSYAWSPDSRQIAYIRLDDSPVPAYPLVDFSPRHVTTFEQHYPQAGEPNPLPSIHVVSVTGQPLAAVTFPEKADIYLVPELTWTPDSNSVTYQVLDRPQTHLDVRLLNVPGGHTRSLLTESDKYWLNVSNFAAGGEGVPLPYFYNRGKNFLWLSGKTGFLHLYNGETASGALTPITSGDWEVERVSGIDAKHDWITFQSTRHDVKDRQIDRVHFDGKGFEQVTSEHGSHRGELSPDGRYLYDSASDLEHPPVLEIDKADGKAVRVLDDESHAADGYALGQSQFVKVTAPDGTILHAMLLKPDNFDPSKKYPVVVNVYGGPSVQLVRDAWGAFNLFDRLLADHGYLVWKLDNRGSWGRGHAFETPIFEHMGSHELQDQLAGVNYLKTLSFVDPSRIGIWGWSYGGYMTLYSITHSPETWKCAIAVAPVTDWHYYDSCYTERYMRTPEDNPQGYHDSSPDNFAGNIKTKLLEVHGTADDNVHPQNTIAMLEAMEKAGVPYDLLMFPQQKHGIAAPWSRKYLWPALLEFFEKNL